MVSVGHQHRQKLEFVVQLIDSEIPMDDLFMNFKSNFMSSFTTPQMADREITSHFLISDPELLEFKDDDLPTLSFVRGASYDFSFRPALPAVSQYLDCEALAARSRSSISEALRGAPDQKVECFFLNHFFDRQLNRLK
ncbi:MAG: hypothetical protein R2827_06985 [Bdellovibrionales bacterium]